MAVSKGFGQYAERQKELKRQFQTNATRAVSDSFLVYGRTIIEKTPVDTALAVSNWQSSIGTPITQVISQPVFGDRGAGVTRSLQNLVTVASRFKLGFRLYIANAVSYIEDLDAGSSAQAPQGMTLPALDKLRAFQKTIRLFR